jgi:hypothetical protein
MRQQRIERKKDTAKPLLIDNRAHKVPEIPQPSPAVVDTPVRAVFYVEVGDMETVRVQLLIQEINKMYEGARGGVQYVIPIRHGKIGSDIVFEEEFLKVVHDTCEIKDDKIVLKDGSTKVLIVRERI